jgi:hypothetical protein
MDAIGRLGTWVLYFGVVGLVLLLGWREPLKNHFMQSTGAPPTPAAQTVAHGPELPVPMSPATPMPTAANGQVEHVDTDVQGNRRMVIFSTPAPTQSGQ